jgi:hypothetical protein
MSGIFTSRKSPRFADFCNRLILAHIKFQAQTLRIQVIRLEGRVQPTQTEEQMVTKTFPGGKAGFTVFLVGLLSCAGANAAIVFSDGNFAPSDWSITTSGSGTSTGLQQTSGGNPGDYRQVSDHMTSSGLFFSLNMMNSAIYTPSTQGAILSLDFSMDAKAVQFAQAFGLAFIQNGVLYVATNYTTNGAWQSVSVSNVHADYVAALNSSSHPDFSSAGAAIQFGFAVGNSNDSGLTTIGAFDNWKVMVNNGASTVPEPASLALLGLGLAGLGFARRRRA